jgi:hypothetical protein
MTGRPKGARRGHRRAVPWLAATILGGSVWGQSVGDASKPVGFSAGPFVIGPSLTAGYGYNSNVYQEPAEASPQSDQLISLQPALQLTVPFSNSAFRFGDTLTYIDYKRTTQTAGKSSNDAVADLTLNFGSLDKLDLAAHHTAGVAETLAFDPGGEVKFQGNAYRLHNETVSISREVAGARGYRFSVQRNVLKFDPSIEVNFINYSGFEGELAYLQPLSENTRLAFGYLGTRYDQFDAAAGSDPNVVFRSEVGDTIYAELEGQLGPRQPYSVRLGWERLTFADNAAPKDFSSVIGQARLSAIVGGGTMFTVVTQRQPYRSNVTNNNFYVFEQLSGQVARAFPRGSSVGGTLGFSRNSYGDPSPFPPPQESTLIYRQDRTVLLEGYANLAIGDRVIFRLSINRDRKYSNYPGADFNTTVVFGGFVLGWI